MNSEKIEGKIIGYVRQYDTSVSVDIPDDAWVWFVVKYYNKNTQNENYILSKAYNDTYDIIKNLSSDLVSIESNKKGAAKVGKIEFSKDNENKYNLKQFTKSEYYKLVADNNQLTREQLDKLYRKNRKENKVFPLWPGLISLLVPIGIFALNYYVSNSIYMLFLCLPFLLISIILIYRSLSKKKYVLSNAKAKMIDIEVIDKFSELDRNVVIFKTLDEKNIKHYVYFTNSDLFKIGKVYTVNIKKYKRPVMEPYLKFKGYYCLELCGFVDSDFVE